MGCQHFCILLDELGGTGLHAGLMAHTQGAITRCTGHVWGPGAATRPRLAWAERAEKKRGQAVGGRHHAGPGRPPPPGRPPSRRCWAPFWAPRLTPVHAAPFWARARGSHAKAAGNAQKSSALGPAGGGWGRFSLRACGPSESSLSVLALPPSPLRSPLHACAVIPAVLSAAFLARPRVMVQLVFLLRFDRCF